MRSKDIHNQAAGNALIEMLLFSPLAMLFLFVVTDAGLALKDRAAMIESLRSVFVSHQAWLPAKSSESNDAGDADSEVFLNSLADAFDLNVANERKGTKSSAAPHLLLEMIEVDVDAETGAARTYSIRSRVERRPENVTDCGEARLEDYVSQNLAAIHGVPIPYSLRGDGPRFLPVAQVIAAQICGRAHGLSQDAVGGILGRVYNFHEEQILSLRTARGEKW